MRKALVDDQEGVTFERNTKNTRAGAPTLIEVMISVETNVEVMDDFNPDEPFKIQSVVTLNYMIDHLLKRTNFLRYKYPKECIKLFNLS